MAPSPDVLYGLRVADSVALIAMLLGAPLLKGPAAQPSSDGHSEITSVVHAVKTPRRKLIVSLLSLAALTAFLETLVTVANALFRHVLETKVPSWRGIEFYSVALFVAFGAFVVVGLLKETRGAPIWQSTLLKVFVVTGLLFDLVIVVFIVLTGDWNEEPKPQDPGAHKRLGFAPLAHFVLLVLRVLVLLVLFPVLFTSLTSYELVDQNGVAPETSEASRLIPAGADDAETSAGLGAPKAKYGTFDAAPPVDDEHAPPVDDANAPVDNKKRDTGEVPGYSVDTPAGSTREAHTLPIPAVDTPDNLSIVPTEAGAVSLGPGPQIVSGEQLAAATVQSEHPVPVKPEQQEPSERPLQVQPDVSFAAVAASAPKAEDTPVLTEEPRSEEPAPIAFPQSEPTPAASPAPLAFPKSDDTPAADSTSPAPQEATSSASTPGITFAPGTEGERLKHAAQRIRKISQGAAAKSQQGLARLARRMSVGPPRASHEGKAEGTPASEDAPKPTEEPKADESAAPVSFPQSEAAPGTSAPLAFPKGEDTASVAGSARPQLREVTSTDSATPSVTFAPNTEGGERVKQAAQRIRKISQGAAAKSQQGLARLARRMSVGPSRQSSISSNIASPPGTPGFLSRSASNSVRPSMDDGAEGSGAEDKKKKDKKDKKDKRKSTIAD